MQTSHFGICLIKLFFIEGLGPEGSEDGLNIRHNSGDAPDDHRIRNDGVCPLAVQLYVHILIIFPSTNQFSVSPLQAQINIVRIFFCVCKINIYLLR